MSLLSISPSRRPRSSSPRSAPPTPRRSFFSATLPTSPRSKRRWRRFASAWGRSPCSSTTPPTTSARRADEVSEEDWDRTMALNLKHQFFAAQIARRSDARAWRRGDRQFLLDRLDARSAAIVGLRHRQGRRRRPDEQPRARVRPDNIRVNAIAPGAVITERQRRLWMSEERHRRLSARVNASTEPCSLKMSRAWRCFYPLTTAR